MVVSKGSGGQRRQRKREADKRKRNQSSIKHHQKANKKPDLILISSDDEDDNILLLENGEISQPDIEEATDITQSHTENTPKLEEFKEIAVTRLRKENVDESLAVTIAEKVWNELESRDIRDVVKVARLTKTVEDIPFIIRMMKRRQ